MLGDNLSTHFSVEVISLCETNNIKFVCFPPNSTHLLQPLDVAFFRPLKCAWRKILFEWKMEADRRITNLPKHHFPSLLKKLCEAISENEQKNLQSGFRSCGIYPFDPNQVLKKLPKKDNPETPTKRTKELVGETVITFLSSLRYGSPGSTPKTRKRKINVSPGLSISVADIGSKESSSEPSTSTSTCDVNGGNKGEKAKKKRKQQFLEKMIQVLMTMASFQSGILLTNSTSQNLKNQLTNLYIKIQLLVIGY